LVDEARRYAVMNHRTLTAELTTALEEHNRKARYELVMRNIEDDAVKKALRGMAKHHRDIDTRLNKNRNVDPLLPPGPGELDV